MSTTSKFFPNPTLEDLSDFYAVEQPLPKEAFSECSIFMSTKGNTTNVKDRCRHLCSNRCYFNAFQPIRMYMCLKKNVRSCGCSPRSLLRGWTVALERKNKAARKRKQQTKYEDGNSEEEGDDVLLRQQSSTLNPWLVVFVSPSHKRFTSIKSVLEALRLDLSSPSYNSPSSSALCGELLQSPSWRDVDGDDAASQKLRSVLLLSDSKSGRETDDRHDPPQTTTPAKHDPAVSPFGLLEELYLDDPWMLLVSCIFLNRTSREQADPVLHSFFVRWPGLSSFLSCPVATLETELPPLLQPLGMHKRRSANLIAFSQAFAAAVSTSSSSSSSSSSSAALAPCRRPASFVLTDASVMSLPNVGVYGLCAYKLFGRRDDARGVDFCDDYALDLYIDWGRAASDTTPKC